MEHGKADLILHNGLVLSATRLAPDTSAVAIREGLICWVGSESESDLLRGPETRMIDCQAGSITPGFIDAHMHLYAYAATLGAVDCSPRAVASIAEVVAALQSRAAETAPGAWVRGWGIEEFHLKEGRLPLREELDAAAPRHPLKVSHRSGHACVLNSEALRILGISEETPEPPGALMERDISGALTGYLLEMEAELDRRETALSPRQDVERLLPEAAKRLLSLGITTVHDATPTRALQRWDAIAGLKQAGGFPLRVHNMWGVGDLDELHRRHLPFGGGDNSMRVGPIKVMLNETGYEVLPPKNELAAVVYLAARQGFQVAFHAVEERAIAAAIAAVEIAARRMETEPENAWLGIRHPYLLRHRIEHGGVCPPDVRSHLAAAGMIVVTQPAFVREHGERYRAQVPDRVDSLYPVGSYGRNGIQVAFGSDCPVVPPAPMIGLTGAIARLARDGKPLGVGEGVTAREALSMYTRGGAYASFDESLKGDIRPGMLADLVVLDGNPLAAPPERLEDIRVHKTIVGGEIVWEA